MGGGNLCTSSRLAICDLGVRGGRARADLLPSFLFAVRRREPQGALCRRAIAPATIENIRITWTARCRNMVTSAHTRLSRREGRPPSVRPTLPDPLSLLSMRNCDDGVRGKTSGRPAASRFRRPWQGARRVATTLVLMRDPRVRARRTGAGCQTRAPAQPKTEQSLGRRQNP
jgi:hypothetical protein